MFSSVLGQAPAVETLQHAIAGGRTHHAYRFEGPAGVGKELTALAFAAALLCPSGGCGSCSTCRRVTTFSDQAPEVPLHPDVVFVGRQLYPQSMVPKREATGISVEQIRKVVLSRSGYSPHEGRALVFIIRDADELTQSAANALLKTLEEPGQGVHFVLLTSRPRRLLDTIRSRTLGVRFRALPDAIVAQILERHGHNPKLAPLAQGSASAALEVADAEQAEAFSAFESQLRAAVSAPAIDLALKLAANMPNNKSAARKQLLSFGQALAEQVREVAETDPKRADGFARDYKALERALEAMERNTSTTLAVEAMLVEMRSSGRA